MPVCLMESSPLCSYRMTLQGCTVVLKPSEMTSVTCLELAAIIDEVGLPPGVFNVVTGLGADAGAPLTCAATLAVQGVSRY